MGNSEKLIKEIFSEQTHSKSNDLATPSFPLIPKMCKGMGIKA